MQADTMHRSSRSSDRKLRGARVRAGAPQALERLMVVVLVAIVAIVPFRAHAQSYGVPPDADTPSAEFLPQDQLDALLAPIALYPDELLAQVLMASTYPLEVVEAARFVQQNSGLTGAALDEALLTKRWDPSVQSLAAFPQVLAMMSDRLEWTQQLGNAFLANRQQVMDTVQALRARAEAVGTLQNSDQQRVYTEDQSIVIQPVQPDYVYVPVYDPQIVYGPWWIASYQPFFWYPPAFFGYPVYQTSTIIVWGKPCHVNSNHWGWAHPVWRAGRIDVTAARNDFFNRSRYRNVYRGTASWQHAPEHRRGVAYGSALVRDRYVNAQGRGPGPRRELRAPANTASGPQRAVPRTLAAPQPAPGYRQVPPDARVAPVARPAPNVVAPALQQAPAQPPVAVPALPRVVVPQAAPVVREAPAYAPRVVRQAPAGPADSGDAGAPRAR
jgi:hypothetical protein